MMQPLNQTLVFNIPMKTKTPHIVLGLILWLGTFASLTAQDYQNAIKLKPFNGPTISYKMMTEFEKGYEIILSRPSHGYAITGLRLYHTPLVPKKSSKWFVYYGFGAHVALYHQYKAQNPFRLFDPPRTYSRMFGTFGLDGCVGLEYRFLKHPFVLSMDMIPNFEVFGPEYFRVNFESGSMGIAYVF